MQQRDAKMGLRVMDDFGAVGTMLGKVYGDNDRRFVKWDGEDEPKVVHLQRVCPVDA